MSAGSGVAERTSERSVAARWYSSTSSSSSSPDICRGLRALRVRSRRRAHSGVRDDTNASRSTAHPFPGLQADYRWRVAQRRHVEVRGGASMAYGYPPLPGAVTGEAVSVELRPARLGSRTVALFIDLVVQFALLFVLAIVAGQVAEGIDTDLASTLGLSTSLLILLGYPVALETLWRGRTLGKAAMGIRVVRDDGGPASFTAIFFRE